MIQFFQVLHQQVEEMEVVIILQLLQLVLADLVEVWGNGHQTQVQQEVETLLLQVHLKEIQARLVQ